MQILEDNKTNALIKKIVKKHVQKIHFIPFRYRVFGGVLQSLNIQFENFIEILIHDIVKVEKNISIVSKVSSIKNANLKISIESDKLIDEYITNQQINFDNNLSNKFVELQKQIIKNETQSQNIVSYKHDVDICFKSKITGKYFYVEIKYNDDHDTGKFVDINRKFLKTYAGLVNHFKIDNLDDFKPILYYFTKKIMKGNIYIPETTNIYRGDKLFTEFFQAITYQDLDNHLRMISEDKEILVIFDNLYRKIRYKTE